MTRSEYCTILTAGMATVASSTLGLYVLFLKDTFPEIAGHLLSASVMGAPASLVMSKIILPENRQPETMGVDIPLGQSEDAGWIDAIVNGAMAGAKLVAGICALLVAFLGLVAAVDLLVGACTPTGATTWSLAHLLGYVFQPFALIMGVAPGDAAWTGQVLGQRLIMTEIPAYQALAEALRNGQLVSPQRTAVIVAYALCGFAHIASLAIFVGGTCALVPERRQDITAVGPRALLAATLACLMLGAVAGTFCTPATVTILSR
jgi:CNT family concentrative nucleoside transporter